MRHQLKSTGGDATEPPTNLASGRHVESNVSDIALRPLVHTDASLVNVMEFKDENILWLYKGEEDRKKDIEKGEKQELKAIDEGKSQAASISLDINELTQAKLDKEIKERIASFEKNMDEIGY